MRATLDSSGISAGIVTPSVATVWLRGFLMSGSFLGAKLGGFDAMVARFCCVCMIH